MTLTINRYFYLVDYYLISNYTSLYCYFLLIGHKNNLQSIHYCYYVSHRKTILQAQCYFYQIVKKDTHVFNFDVFMLLLNETFIIEHASLKYHKFEE